MNQSPESSLPGDAMGRRDFVRTAALSTGAALAATVVTAAEPAAAMPALTPHEQHLVTLWEKHLASEFADKSAQAAIDTMIPEPHLNHIPVLTGGNNRAQVQHFYGSYFIPQMPPDTTIEPISRTIGRDRIVDEFVFKFTHTLRMDWFLPGVEATGRKVEVVKVVVVQFDGDKIVSERIHWDQASVLVQVGLLDAAKLPVSGVEAARKALDYRSVPANLLMKRHVSDEKL